MLEVLFDGHGDRVQTRCWSAPNLEVEMIILGIVLLLLGWLLHISILWTIGLILLLVGIVLWIAGAVGRPIAGRRHYW